MSHKAPEAYSLTRVAEDGWCFIDQDGLSWETPASWLWVGVLGGCGCGSSEAMESLAWRVLHLFAQDMKQRAWSVYDDTAAEVIAH